MNAQSHATWITEQQWLNGSELTPEDQLRIAKAEAEAANRLFELQDKCLSFERSQNSALRAEIAALTEEITVLKNHLSPQ